MFNLAYFVEIIIILITIIFSSKKPLHGCMILLITHNLIPNVSRIGSVSLNTALILIVFLSEAHFVLFKKNGKGFSLPKGSFYYFKILFIPMLFTTTISIILNINNLPYSKSYGQIIQSFIADFLPFTIIFLAIHNEGDLEKIEKAFLASVTIISLYGIYTALIQFNPIVSYFAEATGSTSELFLDGERGALQGVATGNMGDSLSWGQICIVYLSFVIFDPKFKNQRWKILLIILLSANCILSTKRSSIIPMIVLDLYWIVTNGIYRKKNFIYSIGVFIIALICFIKIPALNKIYQQNILTAIFWWNTNLAEDQGVSGSSLGMRTKQFEYVESLISKSPLIGNGAGFKNSFQVVHGTDTYAYGFESFVLFVLADYGWIGLCFWLYFFYYNMKITKGCATTKDKLQVMALHGPYVLALLLTGFFSSTWGYMVLVAYFSKMKFFDLQKDNSLESIK